MSDELSSETLLAIATSELGEQYLETGATRNLPLAVRIWLDALAELRHRARGKLDEPHRWWLTDRGLQQSSSSRIARYKATRLASLDPSPSRQWLDLCSGIGGDLVELARLSNVISVERDSWLGLLQSQTLKDHGLSDRVRLESVDLGSDSANTLEPHSDPMFDSSWWPTVTAWHLDPDRRNDERRSIRPEFHSPSETWIDRLIASERVGCLKLAPAASVPRWEPLAQREWIGDAGECKQQLFWFGGSMQALCGRRVTLLDGSFGTRSIELLPESPLFVNREPLSSGDVIFEPHSALLAAKGSSTFVEKYSAESLTSDGGYLRVADEMAQESSEEMIRTQLLPWGAAFRVRQIEKLDRKRLSEVLRGWSVGKVEWKKRGVPAEWLLKAQKGLKTSGPSPITALVFPGENRVVVALADRIVV